MTGELLRPVVANVDTDPGELAQRLATRLNSDTVHPVIVTDDAGRYVGIVPVTRLLAGLGQPAR
jgi:CBS-domain-containing membrane protein